MAYQITTLDLNLLQAWFDEWLPRLYPPEMPGDFGDPMLLVYPLPRDPYSRELDWPADMRFITEQFRIPRDPKLALGALEDQSKKIETEIAKAEARHGPA